MCNCNNSCLCFQNTNKYWYCIHNEKAVIESLSNNRYIQDGAIATDQLLTV